MSQQPDYPIYEAIEPNSEATDPVDEDVLNNLPDFETWMGDIVEPYGTNAKRGGRSWCDEWTQHPEALRRLIALYQSWIEDLPLDLPSDSPRERLYVATTQWWQNRFDPELTALTNSDVGPFSACIESHLVSPSKRALYRSLDEWMSEWLAPIIHRQFGGATRWCPEWRSHEEALQRLTALWWAWESARRGGTDAMSRWWTTVFDPHWHAITNPEGTFGACQANQHNPERSRPLPGVEIAEEDM